MRAIIIAAGSGSRLGDLCRDRPKCLVKIGENSLLEMQIDTLHVCGVDEVVVVRGYEADKIAVPGITYCENPDWNRTGILHSLFCAQDEMLGELLVLYSDILFEEQVIRSCVESRADIALGVMVNWQESIRQRDPAALSDLEMVHFDSESNAVEIGKRLKDDTKAGGQFVGIMKCSARGTQVLLTHYEHARSDYAGKPFGRADRFENASLADLLQEMRNLGVPIGCVIIERGWIEIDTPQDYQRAVDDTEFIRRVVSVRTDWENRSRCYDRLEWTQKGQLLDAMVGEAAPKRGEKILDVGTGTGKVLIALKERCPDAEYFGVDICKAMLDQIDPVYGFGLSLQSMEDLSSLKSDMFDTVTARMVFHHARDIDKAIREIRRVLKADGKLVVCEGVPPSPDVASFYERMFRFKEERIVFLADDLIGLLEKNGFAHVASRDVILRGMSLDNWLENSGLPFRNIDIIRKMHADCEPHVRRAYNMKSVGDDIVMDWRFSIVSGTRQ